MTAGADHLLTHKEQTIHMLHQLGIPIHRIGYKMLCVAIPFYFENNIHCITKELYTYLAHTFGCAGWRPVERDIRDVIHQSWSSRDPAIWEEYFPGYTCAPSNKVFIAILAERLK